MSAGKKTTPKATRNTQVPPKEVPAPQRLADIIRTDAVYIAILAGIAFLLYVLSVNNGYSLDDQLVTKDDPAVSKGIAGIPDILSSPFFKAGDVQADYRPLAKITFAIERSVFGDKPGVSHFINVLLYTILCVVLFLVLRKIFPSLPVMTTVLGVLLFVVHPLHAEIVNNLKSRDEIMSILLGLVFLVIAIEFFRKGKIYLLLLAIFFLIFSFLSKLSSTPLIFFLVVYTVFFFYRQPGFKQKVGYLLLFLTIWVGYFIVVNVLIFPINRPLTFTEYPLPNDPTLVDRLNIIFPTIYFYMKMMVVPYPLCCYYGYNTIQPAEYKVLIVLLVLSGMLWVFFKGFRHRNMRSLMIVWFLISGFLYFNIVGSGYAGIVSERAASLMSVPGSFLLLLLLGSLVQRRDLTTTGPSKATRYVVYILATVFAYISFLRIFDWKDPTTLYASDLKHYPESGHLNYLIGMNYNVKSKEAGDPALEKAYVDTAAFYFRRVVSIKPDRPITLTYLGRYYIDYYNNLDSAMLLLSSAWENEQLGETAYEIGRVKVFSGKWAESIPFLEYAVEKDTAIHYAGYFLAQAYFETGKSEEALKMNERIKDMPKMLESYHLNAGNFNGRMGNLDKAYYHLREAVVLGNRDQRVLGLLRAHYQSTGDSTSLKWLDELK